MLSKDRACGLVEGTLKDAIENLERTKECMVGWDWNYLSPEDVDEIIEDLKALLRKARAEIA